MGIDLDHKVDDLGQTVIGRAWLKLSGPAAKILGGLQLVGWYQGA
jgi:hypothetical protein